MVPEFDMDRVYTLDIGAMSIFGDGNPAAGQFNLQEYSKMLTLRGVSDPSIVITEVEFDTNVSVPKLMFKPADFWNEAEMRAIDAVTVACRAEIDAQMKIVAGPTNFLS
ncbi:hypothetical protein FM036_44675 [Nostoc sp. HG1]|nr:hypothetical protein [Nostoc sp. HG1]